MGKVHERNKKQRLREGRDERRALGVHFARTKRAQSVALAIAKSLLGLPESDSVPDTRSDRILLSLLQVW